MNIRTKFSIGDDVCFIHDNELRQGKIGQIDINIVPVGMENIITISYGIGIMIDGEIKIAILRNESEVALLPETAVKEE